MLLLLLHPVSRYSKAVENYASTGYNLPHEALFVDHVHHRGGNCLAMGQGGKALHSGL